MARFDLFLHRQPGATGSLIGAALAAMGGLFAILAVARFREDVCGDGRAGPEPWLGVAAGAAVAAVTGYLLVHNLTL